MNGTFVLLVVHTNTYFSGLFPLALELKRLGKFQPVILFADNYPSLREDLAACEKAAIEYQLGRNIGRQYTASVLGSGSEGVELSVKIRKYIRLMRSPRVLLDLIFFRIFSHAILWKALEIFRQIKYIRGFIRDKSISLLILPADNRYDQAVYVKSAHLENIGVVVVPQFMAGPLEWAEYVYNQPVYYAKGLYSRLIAAFCPGWTLDYKGRKLLSLPGADIIAREWLGIAPPLPWVLHSGASDVIVLESEAVREYCLAEGLPPDQINVTGSVAHDILFEALSERDKRKEGMLQKLGLEKGNPVILSALPPDSLYMGRVECDFHAYKDLVEFWCKSLACVKGYNHVVVLHPSVKYQDVKYIEDFGLKIVSEPTASIIPLCDIYVASISSTIQWAIACGIPVINYDVYRYRYTDYANVGGVITVEEKNEFIDSIFRLTNDLDYYSSVVSAQESESLRWGQLDGNASLRLQTLMSTVVLNGPRVNKNE